MSTTTKKKAVTTAEDRLEVRRSGIHGKGVYATGAIGKGERVIEYTGRHLSWKVAMDLPPHRPEEPYHTFLFSLDNGDVIDAGTDGNEARWINHSCAPNCETTEAENRIFVDALRAIEPGEELYYDYRVVPAERRTKKLEQEFACHCGSKKCRGTMLEPKKRRRKRRRARRRLRSAPNL
ncbi:MAG: SET domain-containing protein [Chthoniobacterales bacterium]